MRIEIDTTNKSIKVLEDISIAELMDALKVLLTKDELKEYKIISVISYYPYYPTYPTYPTLTPPYEVTCHTSDTVKVDVNGTVNGAYISYTN